MSIGKRVLLLVVSCALAGTSMVGRATPPDRNSQTKSAGTAGRVAGICQNIMGLSPSERLTGGNRLGNDKLDYWTSHYRGCVLSLSDSLQSVRDIEVVQQAEAKCRAKGLLASSPDLALCVLQAANEQPEPTGTQSVASSQTTPSENVVAPGSYYFASPQETARREQLSCAALGLSASQSEFKSCVKELRDTFYAIDHPID